MSFCSIVPPHILRRIAERGNESDRLGALAALELSRAPRTERQATAIVAGMLTLGPRRKRRTVFDARGSRDLPGVHARGEGARRVRDADVNDAYECAGRAYDFFRRVYGRYSVDDRGLRLEATVHYGTRFSNAHWDGRRMIYGDGDGTYFRRFTSSIDVAAHELTHGVTQYSAGLGASGQSGALAEHFSDVFAILARQYWSGQSAEESDWLIGADLLTERVAGVAIRSMKAPGTAYDDPVLGRDPQPAHMRDYVKTRANDGGIHINSGIPNHAFYQAAIRVGGHAWESVGRVWYEALTTRVGPRAGFVQCAEATLHAAAALCGRSSAVHEAVGEAWSAVGIAITGRSTRMRSEPSKGTIDMPEAGAELPALV
jgi:Zn-dependent metalloprotease